MRNRWFPVLIVLAILVIGFGFYRGWFAMSSSNADKGSSKVNVNLTVDGDKIKEDATAVQDKTAELTGGAKKETHEPVDPASDSR